MILERTDWRMFDPEHVGYLVGGNLRDLGYDDFQDLPPWRQLVPTVAATLHRYTGVPATVAVQTVLVEQYWAELTTGFRELDLEVFHVVLDCDEPELRRRIETDEIEAQAKGWRLDHLERFSEARDWMSDAADLVVDTSHRSPDAVASDVVDAVASKR